MEDLITVLKVVTLLFYPFLNASKATNHFLKNFQTYYIWSLVKNIIYHMQQSGLGLTFLVCGIFFIGRKLHFYSYKNKLFSTCKCILNRPAYGLQEALKGLTKESWRTSPQKVATTTKKVPITSHNRSIIPTWWCCS